MGYMPQQAAPLPPPKRTNCLKPVVGCILGPLLLATTGFACVVLCLAFIASRGPERPLGNDFEPDPTAAAQYEQDIIEDLQNASAGSPFIITINENALSSWLNLEYEELFERYDITLPDYWSYADPVFQVGFDDGHIYFYVENDVPVVSLGTLITAEVFVPNPAFTDYLIGIDIVRIEAGGFNLEEDSATISARLSELITDRIEEYRADVDLNAITVTSVDANDGILTISGTIAADQ